MLAEILCSWDCCPL